MMYDLWRPFLFQLPPECAHRVALSALKYLYPPIRVKWCRTRLPKKPVHVWGMDFPNPVGLAAGLDKTGEYLDALWGLGFGFIELGGVTPRAQVGNPRPRLYRLPEAQALINRMGFNNPGVDALVSRLEQRKLPGIVGVNIGKMRETSLDNALADYLFCYERLYPVADYVTINFSSPNTPGLRDLQSPAYLGNLLSGLKLAQKRLSDQYQRAVPLLVKLSPDVSQVELEEMVKTILKHDIEGIISTNTSIKRDGVEHLNSAAESGGLSGRPLFERSLNMLSQLKHLVQDQLPLVGLGGILSAEDAQAMLEAGADLLQLYTGLVYQGPGLVREIISNIKF